MRKNLTRTGRHSLPVVFMQLFILATGARAQATGKISIEGRNITFAPIFQNRLAKKAGSAANAFGRSGNVAEKS